MVTNRCCKENQASKLKCTKRRHSKRRSAGCCASAAQFKRRLRIHKHPISSLKLPRSIAFIRIVLPSELFERGCNECVSCFGRRTFSNHRGEDSHRKYTNSVGNENSARLDICNKLPFIGVLTLRLSSRPSSPCLCPHPGPWRALRWWTGLQRLQSMAQEYFPLRRRRIQ